MDAIRQQLDRALEQLRTLTPAHRLLVGSFVVILAMALFIVALYSGRSSLVPLPVQEGEARVRAMEYLNTRNVGWEEQGGQIMVPAEERHVLLAQLTEDSVIGGDQIDFDALERLIEFHVSEGTNGLVIAGTTGESATLEKGEHADS